MALKLKELRTAFRFTQEDIAAMLKTTQQSIQRWETGKAEPPLAALRDLAIIFGTSVDNILGKNPFSEEIVTNHLMSLNKGGRSFWGNVGLQFPGDKLSRWYPVTIAEAQRIETQMQSVTEQAPWVVVSTLNDRMLVVNGPAVKQLSLLREAADPPGDDWELGWDSYCGLPPEIYRALARWAAFEIEDNDAGEPSESDTFMAAVEDVVKKYDFTPELVAQRITLTLVRYKDGSERRYTVKPSLLYQAVCYADLEGELEVFDLTDPDEGCAVWVPGAAVALIDMPLHSVVDAAKAESADPSSFSESVTRKRRPQAEMSTAKKTRKGGKGTTRH